MGRSSTDAGKQIQERKIMAVTINTNTSASYSAANLTRSSDLLQKSLARLSSGSRISTPSDDAGGLAVSMKLAASLKRTDATAANVSNAISFLQTASGSLKSAASVLERMSELGTLNSDVTKSDEDKANYASEYTKLFAELTKLTSDRFNGIDLFSNVEASADAAKLTVYLAEDGSQNMTITKGYLSDVFSNITSLDDVSKDKVSVASAAIQKLATMMATNGAESSRLQYALDSLSTQKVNVEAANSRIFDVDVAAETTRLARANILVQSGAAMLAQANAASQIALKLLQ
jgi:flagellin